MVPVTSGRTPIGRLVVFMISLAIAGSIFAGAHYAFVDLPAQAYTDMPPSNGVLPGGVCSVGSDMCSTSPPVVKQICNAWMALWCT